VRRASQKASKGLNQFQSLFVLPRLSLPRRPSASRQRFQAIVTVMILQKVRQRALKKRAAEALNFKRFRSCKPRLKTWRSQTLTQTVSMKSRKARRLRILNIKLILWWIQPKRWSLSRKSQSTRALKFKRSKIDQIHRCTALKSQVQALCLAKMLK